MTVVPLPCIRPTVEASKVAALESFARNYYVVRKKKEERNTSIAREIVADKRHTLSAHFSC